MNVTLINITFMKFDNIWMINSSKDLQFFFQILNIFLNILSENTFDSIKNIWLVYSMSYSNCTKSPTSNDPALKFINFSDVKIWKLVLDFFEYFFTRTCTSYCHSFFIIYLYIIMLATSTRLLSMHHQILLSLTFMFLLIRLMRILS